MKYAVSLFAVNTEVGRRHVRKPPVWKIYPEKFRPAAPEPALLGAVKRKPTPAQQEALLSWFREDLLLNEHHFHWHVVFPQTGDPNNPVPDTVGTDDVLFYPKDRQGELFYYMHRQMLARYDAERVSVGLDPVEPFPDLRQRIPLGYDAGLDNYVPRPDDVNVAPWYASGRTGKVVTPLMTQEWDARILAAAERGFFDEARTLPVTPRALGGALESDADAPDYKPDAVHKFPQAGEFGNLHNMGHMLIASTMKDPLGLGRMGVLCDTATALRDPIFWRWHRHIDDLYDAWLRQRGPAAFPLEEAPPVRFPREHATLLAFRDAIPGAATDPGFDYAAWGRENYARTILARHSTNTLETSMQRRTLHTYEWYDANAGHVGPDGKPLPSLWRRRPRNFDVAYLDQREFVMFHRVEADAPCKVTLRVFLALDQFKDDYRMWIEMDRAVASLQPGMNVVARPAWQFSVVRKPCGKPPLDFDTEHLGGAGDDPPASESEDICDCGWPYNLLLPRGTARGTKARLLVMATDHARDDAVKLLGQELDECCGSLSFCGSKGKKYPDAREMGYPFHAPFPKGGYRAAFKALPNWTERTLTLKWTNPRASAPAPAARKRPAKSPAKGAKSPRPPPRKATPRKAGGRAKAK